MRVLLAETTWAAMSLAHDLNAQGFFVTRCNDAAELFEYADLAQQDIILINHDMPDIASIDCLRRLRRQHPSATIVFMAEGNDAALTLRAFAAGADDVIGYRAPRGEVTARLIAIARRRAGLAMPELTVADLTVDCGTRTARVRAHVLDLTRIEYELLEYLALRQGQIVTRDALMTHLYAFEDHPDDRIIAAYVCHIRAKIHAAGGDAGLVENVWGRGYALVNTAPLKIAA